MGFLGAGQIFETSLHEESPLHLGAGHVLVMQQIYHHSGHMDRGQSLRTELDLLLAEQAIKSGYDLRMKHINSRWNLWGLVLSPPGCCWCHR